MGLIENAKNAAKLVQQIGNIELYEKLVSLQQDAMSVLDENWKLKDEVRSLKEQLAEQKRLLAITDDMEFVEDGGFYIRRSEKVAGRNIPYCPLCWTAGKAAVPLNPGAEIGVYECKIHHAMHQTKAYRDQIEREANDPGFDISGPDRRS